MFPAGASGTTQPVVVTGEASKTLTPQERIQRAAQMIPTVPQPRDIHSAPAETAPVVAGEPAQADKPVEVKASPLKDAVAEMRAKREAAQREAQQRSAAEAENARLKQELEAVKAASRFEDDPIGFAKARKWTREQQLMYGKALIYDLAPEEADPNFRVQMFEDKQKREAREKEEAAERERQEQEQATARTVIQEFAQTLEQGVMAFEAGSYPESEAWYGTDVESYLRDMFETGMRMAQKATKEQKAADLSPAAIATELEADRARRLAERDKRRAMRQPSTGTQQTATAQTVGSEAEQSLDSISSKDMSGSGTPLPPARSDSERVQRAIAAAFPKR